MLKQRVKKGKALNKALKEEEVSSLFELDKLVYGLEDKQLLEWKQRNSSINSIGKLEVPALLIQSKEDPFTQY